MWMSHVKAVCMRHVTRMNETCHTYEWDMSCHTYEWDMSHRVVSKSVNCFMWISHVQHVNKSCCTFFIKKDMPYTWMSHVENSGFDECGCLRPTQSKKHSEHSHPKTNPQIKWQFPLKMTTLWNPPNWEAKIPHSRGTKSNWNFGLILIFTEKFEFPDVVDFGVVASCCLSGMCNI